MYSGHQRNSGTNRQGNGSGNNHHQPGNKNRPIGNNGGPGMNHSRYSGNSSKLNTRSTGNNPSASSSGNSSISSNTSSNNGTNQSPTSTASGSNVKNMGHPGPNWNQYCQDWAMYIEKSRQPQQQHGRESFNHKNTSSIHNNSNTGPQDGANVNQTVGARNDLASGTDKWTGSVNQSVPGPAMPEVTGVTLKENYQTIEGEKKVNSATDDCDPNVMAKPYIPYTNSNRYNSRGNWNNRGGRGGGKGRGFNNSNNRGGSDNRGLIQYQPHGGYYTTPMPAMPAGGLGLPVDPYGGFNYISVAAPFQFAPYLCGEPDFQSCPSAQTCYPPANGLIPQYYPMPAAAFQYLPVSIGAPGAMPAPGVAPTTPMPTLPTLPPTDTYSCTLDIMNNISTE